MIRKEGVYDGLRHQQGRWEKDFFTGINQTSIEFDNQIYYPYLNYPEKLEVEGDFYYIFNLSDGLYLTKEIADFESYFPVLIYEPTIKWPSFTINEFISTYFENRLLREKSCNQDPNSKCKNILNRFRYEVSSGDNEVIKFDFESELNDSSNPIFLTNGFKIPKDFTLCINDNECFQKEKSENIITGDDYPVIYIGQNGLIEKRTTLGNIQLSDYTKNKLFLPDDLRVEFFNNPIFEIMSDANIRDFYLTHPSGVRIDIILNKNNTSKVWIDQRFDTVSIKSRECNQNICNIDFSFKISYED